MTRTTTTRKGRALLLLAAVGVAAALAVSLSQARPAEAAFPGMNGKIAFGREGDIWTVDGEGNQRNLMPGPNGHSSEPAWSPDGTRIAFQRKVDGQDYIFRMNADGTGVRRLTFGGGEDDWRPAWSPDGTRIVFMRFQIESRWDLWTMDAADGSDQRPLVSTGDWDFDPAWSPDGRRIAFQRNGVLWIMNRDGSLPERLSTTGGIGSSPNWSPDGTRSVFDKARHGVYVDEIATINVDGSGETYLTDNGVTEAYPTFSPNGRSIAFTGCDGLIYEPSADCNIRQMSIASGVQRHLTPLVEGGRDYHPDWQPLPAFRIDARPITVAFPEAVRLSGRFTYPSPASRSGRKLTLWEQLVGSAKPFAPVPGAETTTGAGGAFSFEKVRPREDTNYQVRFAGDPKSKLAPATSPIVPVSLKGE